MVTCRSSITSKRAACVLAGARLISSTSTMSAKTGPAWKSKACVCMLNTVVPSTSLGMRSGVNWMRLKRVSMSRAMSRANNVLATPGTPSMSTWPSARMAVSTRSTVASCPTMTWLMLSRNWRIFSANCVRSILSVCSIYLILFVISFIWLT